MKEKIEANLDNPSQLERLYRDNRSTFKSVFNQIYPNIRENPISQVWNERLNFEKEKISWGSRYELTFVIIISILAGLIAKIPAFFAIQEDLFYQRNIGLIVFPFLSAYFAWKLKIQVKMVLFISAMFVLSALYINLLPKNVNSDTLILACIHLPIFLWFVLGYTFVETKLSSYSKHLDFLRYNGDLAVMTAIMLAAGALFSAVTIGLFTLIDVNIEEYYFQYIGIFGLAALPVVGTYLVQSNPQLVNKVSPVIAKVFTPLVFVMLLIYLLTIIITGKDPYNDRDFLLIFNMLLIGVMTLILFSIAETSNNPERRINYLLLLALSFLTAVVNGIALSAILFRISEWGITPNRLAVLGGNVLILIHLLIVTFRMIQLIKKRIAIEKVENSIASYLPVYGLWAVLVIFFFPIIFNFN